MFNDRTYTEITKAEMAQTERALQKLEQAYSNNRMTKAMYLSRRERLIKNLERVVSADTPLFTNPDTFYARNEINLSPRPIGYQQSLEASQELDGQTRKVSESKIRRTALENALVDEADTASIMDALQANATPNNFQSALNAVNEMQASKLLGHLDHHGSKSPPSQKTLAGVWSDISNTPAVTNALAKLREAVKVRVEATIAEGMPISAAENYILSNARNAGAVLTKEGYDRSRAANLVKSVINGEMSVIAAQNLVSADLRDATSAVVSPKANFETQPTVSPNAAKMNTNAMPIKELVEVREAAINTLADPLAFQEELDWAASFVEQANKTLNQLANQKNAITGNSTHQIKVGTKPASNNTNQGDGLPMPIIEQEPVAQPPRKPSTQELVQNISSLSISEIYQSDALPVMINQNLPENNGYAQMIRIKEEEAAKERQMEIQRIAQMEAEKARRLAQEAENAKRIAQEAARKEAAEKARKEAALAAKKAANAAAKKAANEARRAKEAALKAKLEAEARQAQLIEQQKKKEAAEAARLQKIANNEKKKALAEAARLQKIANNEKKKAANAAAKKAANAAAKKAANEARRAKEAALKAKPKPKPMPPVIPKPTPKPKPKPLPIIRPRPPNGAPPANGNKRPLPIPIDPGLIQPIAPPQGRPMPVSPPPKARPIPPSRPPTVKPGPPKSKPINQKKPVNRRTPAEKVANALSRLPSQKEVNNFRKSTKKPFKSMEHTTGENSWGKQPLNKPKKMPLRGVRRSSTSTTTSHPEGHHDPRSASRDDLNGSGLGASTSTTTSSRTSGAYRFEDPRFMHRWG